MGCSCVGWMIENRGLSVLCVYILAGTHEAQRSRGARDGCNKQSYPRSSRASDRDESRDLSRQLGWFFVPQSSKLRYLFISRLLCANNMISSLSTRPLDSVSLYGSSPFCVLIEILSSDRAYPDMSRDFPRAKP